MTSALLLLLVVLLVVLAFEYINGFHDTANAIATVVSTKVLTPRQALMLASVFNFAGALFAQKVAKTIHSGILDDKSLTVTSQVVLAAMLGAIIWNLITWWFGMPSSSTHALVGGLVGAALAASGMNWSSIIWSRPKLDKVTKLPTGELEGIYHKVVVPMITSPLLGFTIGFVFMGLLFWIASKMRPHWINVIFSKLQIVSAAYMGWAHGTADAQKAMGVIMLTLFAATKAGDLEGAPEWLGFLKVTSKDADIPVWIMLTCALVMAAGTYAGGWRIIKTLGHKMVKMQPIHGFAAETTAASVLAVTASMGMTVSTTHTITTSIMGVGAAKRWNAVQWSLVGRIVVAWVLTIPACAVMAYGTYLCIAPFTR
jgi:inorganic phosphate transporter, PiT family